MFLPFVVSSFNKPRAKLLPLDFAQKSQNPKNWKRSRERKKKGAAAVAFIGGGTMEAGIVTETASVNTTLTGGGRLKKTASVNGLMEAGSIIQPPLLININGGDRLRAPASINSLTEVGA
jgi:hypothetical protein